MSDEQPKFTYEFEGALVDDILAERKTATVRIDDDRTPRPGDRVSARHPSGREFAVLEVRAAARVRAIMALHFIESHDAKHGARDPDDLLDWLAEYYPEKTNGVTPAPRTPVQVVVFEVLD
jgi:uncharacterized protein YqfB (UPF0267 family)